MPNKMLIDAAHPEETRVVVLRGNRVEEFDFESASRKQLRGNIYLAKVTRVEPSLQAAFVDYGGNRHGFLAFSEIHPDYYQIPVADRQALIEAEEAEMAEAEARHADRSRGRRKERPAANESEGASVSEAAPESETDEETAEEIAEDVAGETVDDILASEGVETVGEAVPSLHPGDAHESSADEMIAAAEGDERPADETAEASGSEGEASPADHADHNGDHHDDHVVSDDAVESVGAEDAMEEVPERRPRTRARQYKIQEVIKRRQVLLVQVVKEERGNKGAALTTYLSLAGRYSVLMPNTARGGGISRKITSLTDRKRLKQVVSDLEVPTGMGVILRTAGASRTRAEVKRDFEYLLRLWENVRELTLRSTAPTLVYEEGSLIKRSIRDLYNKDIDEVLVAGDDAYREAKDFMRMLMPSHAKNVKPYKESQPLFARSGIEAQLDAMFSPQVTLRSGGYIVINQTEALVSIDVNSGRSTREHNIEDTALQTNLEAAEEVARQLRLRDLAGLIVIDFIDMEEKRNNRSVERKMKDALKNDRARIQVGRISHFGLLEMSRQRIRTGVLESTTSTCPTCQGTGHVRAPASVALHVLRSLEDQLMKGVTHHLTIRTRTVVALYILNQKRQHLAELEQRFGLTITVAADETISNSAHFAIERGEPVEPREIPALVTPASFQPEIEPADEAADEVEEIDEEEEENEVEERADSEERDHSDHDHSHEEGGGRRRRRRRRGRGGEGRGEGHGEHRQGGEHRHAGHQHQNRQPQHREPFAADAEGAEAGHAANGNGNGNGHHPNGDNRGFETELGPDGQPRRRRRGRRGGRRGRRGRGNENGGNENRGNFRGEDGNRQPYAGGQQPSYEDQPPASFQPSAFDRYDDEIDTTPRLEPEPSRPAVQRADLLPDDVLDPGEIDTTPQIEPRGEATRAAEPQPEPEPDDPNRPKRSGWWQRKSFFG